MVIAMRIQDMNPFLRFAESQPSVFEGGCLRRAYDCRIFYALSGEGILHVKDKEIEFKSGSLAFMPFDYGNILPYPYLCVKGFAPFVT